MLKDVIERNEDFKLDWHDPDEATDGYQLKWIGKDYARLLTGRETETVIIPDSEHNKTEENKNSKNLFFTGDNLDVLKHLQNAYSNSIKMIYIDPPYNTGSKDFVYPDNFEFTDIQLKDMLGLTDEEIKRLHTINGKSSHSAWLTFMYPRLRVARKLLTEDGVIFISIDDNEQANLKLLCDEVFGEDNFIATLIWKSKSGGANDSRFFAIDHEYILAYARNTDKFNLNIDKEALVSTSYNRKDEYGEYALDRLDKQSIRYSKSLDFEIIDSDGNVYTPKHKDPKHPNATWRWSKQTVKEHFNELVFEKGCVYTKNYKKDGAIARSLLVDERFGRTRTGKTDLFDLFNNNLFSNPKPYKLLRYLNILATDKNSIILDFFAGSATSAHACMQLNAEDGGNRKFIMVQIPEPTKEDSEAKKEGFNTIDEIAMKRIELAGEKIKKETGADIDYGFKHYYVKEANVETVSKIMEYNPESKFIGSDDMVREFDNDKSKGEDVILRTWLTDDGYKFDIQPNIVDIKGYKAYYIDNSVLYLISQDWGAEQTKELLNLVGNYKLNLNTIIIYGYSFSLPSMKELEINIKQNLDHNILIEKRY